MHKMDETNGNTELLQPYPITATDALLQICAAIFSVVLSITGQQGDLDSSIMWEAGELVQGVDLLVI